MRLYTLLRHSFLASIALVFSKLIGIISSVYLAAVYGASMHTDAYFLGLSVVYMIGNIGNTVFQIRYLPFYLKQYAASESQAISSARSLMTQITRYSWAISIGLCAIAIGIWSGHLFKSEEVQENWLMFALLILALPSMLRNMIQGVILQANQDFTFIQIVQAIRPLGIMAGILVLHHYFGVHAAAVGFIISGILTSLILDRRLPKPAEQLTNHELNRQIFGLKRDGVLLFATALIQFRPVIDRISAHFVSEGSATIFNYAETIASLPLIVLSGGLLATITTLLTRQEVGLEEKKHGMDLASMMNIVALASAVMTCLIFFLRQELVELLLKRRAYDEASAIETYTTLGILVWYIIPTALEFTLLRHFVAKDNSKPVIWMYFASFVANIVFNVLFIPLWGVHGLAWSSIVNSIICWLVMLWAWYQEEQELQIVLNSVKSCMYISLLILSGGYISWWLMQHTPFETTNWQRCIIFPFICAAIWVILGGMMKQPEIHRVLSFAWQRISKRVMVN